MPRQTRMESAGAFYHVLNRGNYRQDVFTVGDLREYAMSSFPKYFWGKIKRPLRSLGLGATR